MDSTDRGAPGCAGCAQRQQAGRRADDHVLAVMTVAFVAVILASAALFKVRGLSRVIDGNGALHV